MNNEVLPKDSAFRAGLRSCRKPGQMVLAGAVAVALVMGGSVSAQAVTAGVSVAEGGINGGTATVVNVNGMSFTQVWNNDASATSFGITDQGVLYGWGSNSNGQLGAGASYAYAQTPTPVVATGALAGKTITQVTEAGNSTIALASDGTVYSWGAGARGQLGNGSTADSNVPVAVTASGALAGKSIVQVAGGSNYAAALASDGTVFTWGDNTYGQLGAGVTYAFAGTPVAVTMTGTLQGKKIAKIEAGASTIEALTTDGAVFSWGDNTNGALGAGVTYAYAGTPVAVSTSGVLAGKTITDISAGNTYALALDSNGAVYSWGLGSTGQLGNGANANANAPVAVTTSGVLAGKKVASVTAGSTTAFAETTDGSLVSWGDNTNGALGAGANYAYAQSPVAVASTGVLQGKTVTAVSAGTSGANVVVSDGTLFGWGANGSGQIGNGSATAASAPVAATMPAVAVTFGGTAATRVTRVNLNQVSVLTPAHAAGTVDVVATAGGNAAYPTTTLTARNAFQYDTVPAITTGTLAAPVVGKAYNDKVTATGTGTVTYSVSSGSLPVGLSLDSTTGAITGTPTTSGSTTFAITATNASGSDTKSYTLMTNAAATITTSSLAAPVVGKSYSDQVTATGTGTITYSISSGGLPAGLSLDSRTGKVSGTPTTEGTVSFTVTALNDTGSDSKSFTLSTTTAPSIGTSSLTAPIIGRAYNDKVSATGTATITYAVSAGSLPVGLELNSATGAITGTPTVEGRTTFSVTASSPSGTDSRTFTLVTTSTPTIATSTLSAPYAGKAYNDQVTATGTGTITFSISSGGLPTGLSLDSRTGKIAGTPTQEGTATFTVTALNDTGSDSKSFTLVTTSAPSIATLSLPQAVTGKNYSEQISTSGTKPVTFAVTTGQLPNGLTLDTNTGQIMGSSVSAGSVTFTVTATNAVGADSRSYTLVTVTTPTITTTSLGDAGLNEDYNATVAATGSGPITYAVTAGALPDGITLDANTGTLSGQATTGGSFSFGISATNSGGAQSKSFTINVETAPAISTTTLEDAIVGSNYAQEIDAAGSGTISYAVTDGALPDGLTLNSRTGVISGTATSATSAIFTVTATSSNGSDSQQYTLVTRTKPVLSAAGVNDGITGTAYSQQLNATGSGTLSYEVTSGALPAGLSLDAATGIISGTPTGSGTTTFVVRVSSQYGSDLQVFAATVHTPPAITTSSVTDGTVGKKYSQSIAATGEGNLSYTMSSGSLPAGLTLDTATGAITGTPTAGGTSTFTITVVNAFGSASKTYTTTVHTAPTISTGTVASGTVRKAYAQTIVASGEGTLSYAITKGALPKGLVLNKATGAIKGTPTASGTSTYTVTVTNKYGAVSKAYTVKVAAAKLTASVPAGKYKAGSKVVVTVAGLENGETATLKLGTTNYGTVKANTAGIAKKTVVLNAKLKAAKYSIVVTGNKHGKTTAKATLTVVKMTASVPAGKYKAGSKVVVTVAGLENGETVTLRLGTISFGTAKANTAGVAKKTVTLSAKLKTAKYTIQVTGSKHGKTVAKAPITVVKK